MHWIMWHDSELNPQWQKLAASGGWRWLYFCKYFCQKIWLLDQSFYGGVLSRQTVTIDPDTKPIILEY